ncbi:hypothetical protein PENSUB_5607 [Penicillium subrubescens]|uniref:Uncharacterized protein n=1 Tax=Penicillium subrubescens TaxID=1316194 RepID=A0A1Q5U708_9EURO|nr:hypothetical protein PENSUB_5607 [Penicillium subrubescens]
MAQYEHHQNRFQQGSAHVQGLWQISQLRGGVSNLTGSPSGLGQKMLRYAPAAKRTNRVYTNIPGGSIWSPRYN